ncbi:MAG: hypothetical protein PVJ15_07470, partial [Gammaproteobacteria bacterium]
MDRPSPAFVPRNSPLLYADLRTSSPRRHAGGKCYFEGRHGVTGSGRHSNRREEHLAVALRNACARPGDDVVATKRHDAAGNSTHRQTFLRVRCARLPGAFTQYTPLLTVCREVHCNHSRAVSVMADTAGWEIRRSAE